MAIFCKDLLLNMLQMIQMLQMLQMTSGNSPEGDSREGTLKFQIVLYKKVT